MLHPITHSFKYGQHNVTIETDVIARQATAAVMVSVDDTTVLVTMVADKQVKSGQNFLPLTVHYQERTYAFGRFPGSFFRREGRPSEREILTSRLIDRPIRPLFPEGFINEIQIIATVVSVNPQINPDIVAIIGVSTTLSLSGVPFNGPIGVARVGYINNEYILNPSIDQLTESSLDLIVSGTSNAIVMVESEARLLNETQILDAILFGYTQQQVLIDNINVLVSKIGQPKWSWQAKVINTYLKECVIKLSESRFNDAYLITERQERNIIINNIKTDVLETLINKDKNFDENEIKIILNNLEKKLIRHRILNGSMRIDGREKDVIRSLDTRISVLPRTHGSALFTRGNTQALVTVTLGTERNAQHVEEFIGERSDRFLLHYNFPPYCVGEIGMIGSPKRREIGHGRLAKRALLAVMPNINEFPYTIRVVSEITESNGSSSMASICGASMALMDAGVPIKSAVAGIAMGLIKENDQFIILSDILGDEDYLGDMDFKVAGSYEGITALQMDIKIAGITREIMKIALDQAKSARIQILNTMIKTISTSRKEISMFAPRIHTIKINPEKIRHVIGKGGSVIRTLTEETDTIIEIEDDGTIKIIAINSDKASYAIRRIEEITDEIEVGRIYYNSKVTRIADFGAFVSIGGGGKEGLVHISQISNKHVKKVADHLELGQKVSVKVLEIDRQGRVRLSIKEAIISS